MPLAFLLIVFFAVTSFLPIQAQPKYNKVQLEAQLKKSLANSLKSFFIVADNSKIASNSNAYLINSLYYQVKRGQPCSDFVFVFNPSFSSPNYIKKYFNEVLKIPFDSISSYSILFDSTLYNVMMNGDILSKIAYVSDGKVEYWDMCKYSGLENAKLSCTTININLTKKTHVDQEKYLQSELNSFLPYKHNLIHISDINNRVGIINPVTGKHIRVFDQNTIDPIALYKRLYNPTKKKLEYAISQRGFFKKNNRLEMPIYSAATDGNRILLFGGLQIIEKLTEPMQIANGSGGFQVLPVGTDLAKLLPLIIELDSTLTFRNAYRFDEESKENKFVFASPGGGVLLKNDTLFAFNEPDITDYKAFIPGVCALVRGKKNNFQIMQTSICPTVPDYSEKGAFGLQALISNWNNKVMVCYSSSPLIYSYAQPKPLGRLTGDGTPDAPNTYPKHFKDTTQLRVNWRILNCAISADKKLAYFLYEHKGKRFLEVKDRRLQTIQLLPVDDKLPATGDAILTSDAIHYFVREADGEFYFYTYSL